MEQDLSTREHRQKRVRHFDEPSHAHFLTFSCYRRLPLLSRDRSRHWFIEALQSARQKHGFDLWGWVIMPGHVHLLLWPAAGYRIHKILADIKRPVGQQAIDWLKANDADFLERLTVRNRNRTYHRFWQAGPGQDRNIYDPVAVHQVLEYVHNNAVKRGLVRLPEQWQWSSARDWGGKKDVFLKVDRTVPSVTEIVT